MSSFKWGMIACITLRKSQVIGREVRHHQFSHHSRHVLLTVLHSDALLTSASIPLHFGLSLSNPLEQISLPYINWKGTFKAFIGGMAAWFATRNWRVTNVVPFYIWYSMNEQVYLLPWIRAKLVDSWAAHNLSLMDDGPSWLSLDGVQYGVKTKVCPKRRCHKMAWRMVYVW